MLYFLIRPVARYVLRYYYRNIDLTGLEHLPADAAVILAANHPTGFIEPCLLACFQPRPLHFLARGSVFVNGFYNRLLAAVNILPVFRLEDGGYERLKENFDTFAACYRVLSRRQAIMILAEGRCIHEKKLRPLRKGTARIALGALDRDPTLREVYIVPVGINYTHAERARSTVMIRCGAPLRASAYLERYRSGEAAAIRDLTRHLRTRLSPLVVQFPDQERAGLGEALLALDRIRHPTPTGLTASGEQLDRELAVAAGTPASAPALTRFFNRLDRQRISAAAFLAGRPAARRRGALAWATTLLGAVLLLPQLPLWLLAEYVATSRPRHVEFYSPVRFAVVTGGTFLLYPVALLLLPWPLKIYLLLSTLSVNFGLRALEAARRWHAARRAGQLPAREREILRDLHARIASPPTR